MSFTTLCPTHFGKINKTGIADHSDYPPDSQVSSSHTQSLSHSDKTVFLLAV